MRGFSLDPSAMCRSGRLGPVDGATAQSDRAAAPSTPLRAGFETLPCEFMGHEARILSARPQWPWNRSSRSSGARLLIHVPEQKVQHPPCRKLEHWRSAVPSPVHREGCPRPSAGDGVGSWTSPKPNPKQESFLRLSNLAVSAAGGRPRRSGESCRSRRMGTSDSVAVWVSRTARSRTDAPPPRGASRTPRHS